MSASKDKWVKAGQKAESEMSGGVDRVKFQPNSTTIVRCISTDFTEAYVAFVDEAESGETRKIVISPDDVKDENHPYIAEWKRTGDGEMRPQHKYFMNVLLGRAVKVKRLKKGTKELLGYKTRYDFDSTVKLFEIGPKIFIQIQSYHTDDDYPDVNDAYLKIERTGSSKNDTNYVVKILSADGAELPEDITEAYDLEELATPTSLKEISRILGIDAGEDDEVEADEEVSGDYDEEVSEEDEKKEAKSEKTKSAKTKSAKTKKKPAEETSSVEEELEELDDIEE